MERFNISCLLDSGCNRSPLDFAWDNTTNIYTTSMSGYPLISFLKHEIPTIMTAVANDLVLRRLLGLPGDSLADAVSEELGGSKYRSVRVLQGIDEDLGKDRVSSASGVGHRLVAAGSNQDAGGLLLKLLQVVLAGVVPLQVRVNGAGHSTGIAGVGHNQHLAGGDSFELVRDASGVEPVGVVVKLGVHRKPIGGIGLLVQDAVAGVINKQAVGGLEFRP